MKGESGMDRIEQQKYVAAMRENNEALLMAGETYGTNSNGVRILIAEIDALKDDLDMALRAIAANCTTMCGGDEEDCEDPRYGDPPAPCPLLPYRPKETGGD